MSRLEGFTGLTFYVQDIHASQAFYEMVGFSVEKQADHLLFAKIDNLELHIVDAKFEKKKEFVSEAQSDLKGGGLYINIEVKNVDTFYKYVQEQDIKTSSAPRDWPWGRREFVLRDPDGYKFVFFHRLEEDSDEA